MTHGEVRRSKTNVVWVHGDKVGVGVRSVHGVGHIAGEELEELGLGDVLRDDLKYKHALFELLRALNRVRARSQFLGGMEIGNRWLWWDE